MPNTDKDWFTAADLARLLKTNSSTIYRLARSGKLETKRIGKSLHFRYDNKAQLRSAQTNVSTRFLAIMDQVVEKYHDNPWFALVAGVSSILGFLALFLPVKSPEQNRGAIAIEDALRITYMRVGGRAMDLLSRGEISPRWENILGGQPFIIPNSVLKETNFLVQNFSAPMFWDEVKVSKSKADDTGRSYASEDAPTLEHDFKKFEGRNFFVGSQLSPSPTIELTATARTSLLDEIKVNRNWVLRFYDRLDSEETSRMFFDSLEKGFLEYDFYFSRYVESRDIEPFRHEVNRMIAAGYPIEFQKVLNFYRYVMKAHLPPNFFTISFRYQGCGDAALVFEWNPVFLEVAVIENASSQALSIGNFFVKEITESRLRTYREDKKTLEWVFRTKPAGRFAAFRPAVSLDSGQPFRSIPAPPCRG